MIIITNIFAMPFLLILWCIDAYLFAVLVRYVLSRFLARTAASAAIERITDPPVIELRTWTVRRTGREMATWLAWTVVIVLAVSARSCIATILVSTT